MAISRIMNIKADINQRFIKICFGHIANEIGIHKVPFNEFITIFIFCFQSTLKTLLDEFLVICLSLQKKSNCLKTSYGYGFTKSMHPSNWRIKRLFYTNHGQFIRWLIKTPSEAAKVRGPKYSRGSK